ncbi:MAG: hypothetical protein NZ849_06920 [Meiothermus sp.]|uniref:hypothetical protein n=1 Tax=Meiothermus sp. TaxID=1955249 RepID=UPI0025E4C571|nr:hypothetical protein [Meiothermus sp.]MCS7057781.1 hypothetical protein [Meiothermus sp.]MCS7194624.1 hypothetical protein [Meiothermus sp.]MCX7740813.1 hypothetical protein [Meiothermus sp.]MDW8090967.1 hypothetical protein [Meiothermus sp.]MDW8481861.1 hypothetical protein [Meiothermus sp.]
MSCEERIWQSIGRGKVRPSEVLNALTELDNRKGPVGLYALEQELRRKIPYLRPTAQPLAQAWLEATVLYRETYYPESRLSRLFQLLNPSRRTT